MKRKARANPRLLVHLSVATFAAVFFLGFSAVSFMIGSNVRAHCAEAVKRYGGDCVPALQRTVEDESNSFRMRNDAVWSLGQLGDRRALATIGKYYTGEIPVRESYDGVLSQYELFKAMRLIASGLNITSFLWR